MRNVLLQLFVNDSILKNEIGQLQSKPQGEWNDELIQAKHDEWDRNKHVIDLFLTHLGI